MVKRAAFFALLGAVALQRLFELQKSRRNEARLRARGAIESVPGQLTAMRILHGAWLAGTTVEVLRRPREVPIGVRVSALFAFASGEALRYAAMRALGPRWTVRVLALPGERLVRAGPYRYLRHPNYVGVALEIAALPLAGGAYLSAALFSVLDALLLAARIREERAALDRAGAR